ncbi:MAG: AsmA family protein [Pseudomonadota bacterium]
MIRPLRIAAGVIVLAAVVTSIESIVASQLRSRLTPLLEEALGIPVTLATIRLDLIELSARSQVLQLGTDSSITLRADDLFVDLNWTALLQGVIQFDRLEAETLAISPAGWPTSATESADPGPTDFSNFAPWLPHSLQVGSLHINTDSDNRLVFSAINGSRRGQRLELEWESGNGLTGTQGFIAIASLPDLLALQQLEARLRLQHNDDTLPDSDLSVMIGPAADAAYELDAKGVLAGMAVTLQSTGEHAWRIPQRSSTSLDVLAPIRLGTLLGNLAAVRESVVANAASRPEARFPKLSLPVHEASVLAADVKLKDKQVFHDFALTMNSDGNGAVTGGVTLDGPFAALIAEVQLNTATSQWRFTADASLTAHTPETGILQRYNDTPIVATEGALRLRSAGATTTELINALEGEFRVKGLHRGADETALSLQGKLDSTTSALALSDLHFNAGASQVSGRITYSRAHARHAIAVSLRSPLVDLSILKTDEATTEQSWTEGTVLPSSLPFSDIDADVTIEVEELRGDDLSLTAVALNGTHHVGGGAADLRLTGANGGTAALELGYVRDNSSDLDVNVQVQTEGFDAGATLGWQDVPFAARADISLLAAARGRDTSALLDSLHGSLDVVVDARRDKNWSREGRSDEQFVLSSQWKALGHETRLAGAELTELRLDSEHHQLSGTASVAADRSPVFIADIEADQIDIDRIQGWFSSADGHVKAVASSKPSQPTAPAEKASLRDSDLLYRLRSLPTAAVSVDVKRLQLQGFTFSPASVEASAVNDQLQVESLKFANGNARVQAQLALNWQGPEADLSVSATVDELNLRDYLPTDAPLPVGSLERPLSGKLSLNGAGNSTEDLLGSLTGSVFLDDGDLSAGDEQLDISFERLADGSRIRINRLNLGGTDLEGEIRRTFRTHNRYDIELQGAALDLRPWQAAIAALQTQGTSRSADDSQNPLQQTARFAGGLFSFAGAIVGRPPVDGASAKLMDTSPIDVRPLRNNNFSLDASFSQAFTSGLQARELTLKARSGAGRLQLESMANELNGGPVQLSAQFNANTNPYQMAFRLDSRGVHRDPEMVFFPLSTDLRYTSEGNTEAELARNLQGVGYIELGEGRINLEALSFVSADVATSALRTLIPGAEATKTELKCGVTLLQASNGHVYTPYGYIVRTGTANLLGGLDVDMAKETVSLRFQSRSRDGVGISLGNAFSGTVEVAGPLSDPQIVPNTPGLIFRGWAAFATAGLSVIGESMFNRLLASSNPCRSVRKEIKENFCGAGLPLGKSPLACRPENDPADSAPLNPTVIKPIPIT